MAIPLMWDPASGSWVPEDRGRTPMEVVQVPSPSAQAEAIASRVTALEQRIASPFEFDAAVFPYGSQWWMGYTISADNSQVLVHNVGLHYNRGFVSGGTTPFTFAVGVGETITMGFTISLTTGVFTATTGLANLVGPTVDAGTFAFPVYQFTRGVLTSDAPSLAIDYVHGSNIGW